MDDSTEVRRMTLFGSVLSVPVMLKMTLHFSPPASLPASLQGAPIRHQQPVVVTPETTGEAPAAMGLV
jgi:hypothetical protein